MKIKINQLEQRSRNNTLIISSVTESYAERTDAGGSDEKPPLNVREDTIKTESDMIQIKLISI